MGIRTIERLDGMTDDDRPQGTDEQVPLPAYFEKALTYMNESDGQLLRVCMSRRMRIPEVARLLGRDRSSVMRRVRVLSGRLADPMVACLVASPRLSERERQIGLDRFLRRRGLRTIATERGLTLSELRRHIDVLRGFVRGHGAGLADAGKSRQQVD